MVFVTKLSNIISVYQFFSLFVAHIFKCRILLCPIYVSFRTRFYCAVICSVWVIVTWVPSFPLILVWFIYQNVSNSEDLCSNARQYEILHSLTPDRSFITRRKPCNDQRPRCDIACLRGRLFSSENPDIDITYPEVHRVLNACVL